jgi:delta1-piperideine-2-carboxylate reductase
MFMVQVYWLQYRIQTKMEQQQLTTTPLTLDEIYALVYAALRNAGSNDVNASAVSRTVTNAERDGSHSHGLFRVAGYVKSLKSGKVDGNADPEVIKVSPSTIRCDAKNAHAPLALERATSALAELALEQGIAACAIVRSHHFAALWPETEALAEKGLVALTGVNYKNWVAPAGGREPIFGTNPLSFAWPRPGKTPLVFDMATSAMALGDIQIAARDGKEVPLGTGLNAEGKPTTDPSQIANGGILLPFGGYKGSAIALMVELMASAMVGEAFSYETALTDNNDGGPPPGGQFLLAISPAILSGNPQWSDHAEQLLSKLENMEGVRLPGGRRHQNRLDTRPRDINSELVETVRELAK